MAVLYPVTATQAIPTFTKLEQGGAVMIESSYGTDCVFLGFTPFDFHQGDLTFHGQRGTAQVRADGAHLSLSGQGQLRYKRHLLTNDKAAMSKTDLVSDL